MAIRFPTTADYLSLTGASLSIDTDGTVFIQLRNPAPDLTGGQYRNGLTIFTGGTTDYNDAYIFIGFEQGGGDQLIELDVWNGVDPLQSVTAVIANHRWVTGGIGFTYDASAMEFELFVNGVSQGTATMDMSGLAATAAIVGGDTPPPANQPGISVAYPRIAASVLTGAQLAAEGDSAAPITMVEMGLSPLDTTADLGFWTSHGSPVNAVGPLDVPTNVTPSTATAITTLPYTVTADATDAPTSALVPTCSTALSGLWWVYTPPTGITAIGIALTSTSDPVVYTPGLSVWTGTLPVTLTQRDECCYTFKDPTHVRIGVTPGTPNYLLITNDQGGSPNAAEVTLNVQVLTATAPAGSLHVTSDIGNQATIIVSGTTGTSVRAVGMAASEQGDFVPSGVLAIMGEDPADANTAQTIELWNTALTVKVASVTSIIRANQLSLSPIRSNHNATFYVSSVLAAAATVINTVSTGGVVGGTSWTLPANSAAMHAMGVTHNGNTLYYCHETNNTPIYAYNLAGSAALPNFLAAPGAGFRWQRDLWVTASGDVLVMQKNTGTSAQAVLRYNAAGVLQATYAVSTTIGVPRFGISGDESYFVVMSFPTTTTSRFETFLLSGTSPVVSFTVDQNDGAGEGPLFGPAQSCPLLILPVDSYPVVPPPGPGTTRMIRRVRQFLLPSSDSNKAMFMPELEVLMQTGIGDGDPDSQGYDPVINLSISKDGGKTFGPEQTASVGKQGDYTKRVRFRRTPNRYRNGVVRIVATDPVDWTLVDVLGKNIREGSS